MQGPNNQNGRFQRSQTINVPKTAAPVSADEFKYGFPSGGLEVVSRKWWESSSSNSNNGGKNEEKERQSGKSGGANLKVIDGEKDESEAGGSKIDDLQDQEICLLLLVRKRAREEGRKALKLGVYGVNKNKLGRRKRKLLGRIFDSALPSLWTSSGGSES